MRQDPAYLTTTEVADALGVTDETVREFIRKRRLRAEIIGGGKRNIYRVRREDFEQFKLEFVRDSMTDSWE